MVAVKASTLAALNVVAGATVLALFLGPRVASWWQGSPVPAAPPRPVAAAPPRPVDAGPPPATPAAAGAAASPAPATGPELPRGAAPVDAGTGPTPLTGDDAGPGAECGGAAEPAGRPGPDPAGSARAACLARLGREAYQDGQLARAAARYRQAADADPEHAGYWSGLAIAQMKAGDLDGAEQVIERAVARFPGEAEPLYLLAELRERQGRTREALAVLRRLLARHPDHARGRSLAGTLDREQRVEGAYWAHESRHFLVRYEGAQGLDLGRALVDALEEAHDALGRDLGVYPGDRVQVGVYAAPVFGEVIGVPPHLIAGAYDGRKIRLNLSASAAGSTGLERLVRHEYAHLLIHLATGGRAPVWVHEGLAQTLEPRAAPRALPVGVSRELLTLAGIERLSRTGNAEALVAGYGLTHVAVEFLVERGGLEGVRAFLRRLGGGDAPPAALHAAFGVGPDEVEARLRAVAGKS